MQIRRIHIENFGKLHQYEQEFAFGLNTVCADNGWGKSTLAAFIKAMFYGLPYTTKRSLKENERKHYFPWQGGTFGGSMEFEAGGREYRVERFFGAKEKEDTYALYDLVTGLECKDYTERLGEELFHVDRNAYARSSFFTQQDFAAVSSDSLNSRLTRVEETAGDMQNYEKAMAKLEERMRYYQKTGARGHLDKLKSRRQDVLQALSECGEREEALGVWRARKAEKEEQVAILQEELSGLERELANVRDYETKFARRSQNDHLRLRAEHQAGQLQQLVKELNQYDHMPASEEELDECHAAIFQLRSLAGESEGLEKMLGEQRTQDEEGKPGKEQKKGNALWTALLVLTIGGVLAYFWYRYMMIGMAITLLLVFFELIEARKRRGKRAQQEEQEELQQQRSRQLKADADRMQQEKGELLAKLRETMEAPEQMGMDELEDYWKQERKKSREYAALQLERERLEKEASQSREAWMAYRKQFSEEELESWENLEEPKYEYDTLANGLSVRRNQLGLLQDELRGMENQIQRLEEASEQAMELSEEEERLAQELEEGSREYLLLEKTAKYLQQAQERFSTKYLKDLQEGIQKYLSRLVPEEETTTVLDVKLKARVRAAGASRDLEYMSAGWQDLVQIAERLAIVDALYQNEQPMLILDDPFVNLDTEKHGRALALLRELSQTRQLLYFTCRNNG